MVTAASLQLCVGQQNAGVICLLENDPTVTAEAVRNLEETEIEGIIGLVRLENPCGE